VNPLLLVVDTTREFGSLALARGHEILEELPLHAPDGFAHVIYGELDRLLKRHGVSVHAIDCFASASGPGSFTGVRVGLACVKGLAEACGKPAVAVSNLEAIASFGSAPLRAAVLDARRGEVYAAVYDAAGTLIVPETVTKFAAWFQTVPEGAVEFVSTDFTAFCDDFAGTRFENAPRIVAPRSLAAAIARIACERLLRGAASDPAALDANYVRRSDAELLWKE
jgi:tRNA threonylcarbamoyladenosine biosynthesis protein TsaB